MKVIHDYNMKNKNTFHIDSVAENFYIPDKLNDLKKLVLYLNKNKENFYILSGGSNILINDKKKYKHVIYMSDIDKKIINKQDGIFYIGASSKIQDVIKYVNECGYGGIEELFGLPALFGGIIYMNAGIGSKKNQLFNISDYIIKVKVFHISTKKILFLKKNECDFSYRKSIFQNNEFIILGAYISLKPQSKEMSITRIQNRMKYCRDNHIWGKGCFGSCFCVYTKKILNIIKLFNITKKTGVYQSPKNSNWLVNKGNATYDDVLRFIKISIYIHKLLKRDIECEVQIWD